MGQTTLFADAFQQPLRATILAAAKPHQLAVDGWSLMWLETRGVHWAWSPRDAQAIKRTLKLAEGNVALLLERARRLLTKPPSAWYAANASPVLLYAKWNELAVTVRGMTRDEKNAASLRAALEVL